MSLRHLAFYAALLGSVLPALAHAQAAYALPPSLDKAAPAPRLASNTVSQTTWAQLKPEQKSLLAPLERDWSSISGVQQRKWLELAARFPSMPAPERERIRERMVQWAALTPAKRNQVRLQFLEAKQLPAEQRQARWQEYQALSDEEKRALALQAKDKGLPPNPGTPGVNTSKSAVVAVAGKANVVQPAAPTGTRPVSTTALQVRPGATTRPLTTPAQPPAHHQPGLPKIAATEGFVDPATMLPKRGPQGAAVRSALTGSPPAKP